MTNSTITRYHGILHDDYRAVCGAWPVFFEGFLSKNGWGYSHDEQIPGYLRITLHQKNIAFCVFTIRAASATDVFVELAGPNVGGDEGQKAFRQILDMFVTYRKGEREAFETMTRLE